jgi:putative toxin-antitoxin system antitoxin component (TIGR02293 family)
MSHMGTALSKPRAKKSASTPVARRALVPDILFKKVDASVVIFCVHGASGKIKAQDYTPSKLIKSLKNGLPIHELDDLRSHLDLPMEKLVPMLGISKATLHRRKLSGRLEPDESDRVVRFARLLGKAVEVLESTENARKWLSAPQVGLGGAVPLEYAESELGAREVENLLGRIEYGVYS